MHRKHLLILALLVLLPLLAFFTLGRRLVLDEQERTRRQFEDLLRANLSETDRTIAGYFAQVEQRLLRQDLDPTDSQQLQDRQRNEPLFEQIIVLAKDGSLVHPNPLGPLTRQETDYLMKIESLISDRSLLRRRSEQQQGPGPHGQNYYFPVTKGVALSGDELAKASKVVTQNEGIAIEEQAGDYGWFTWYWGQGLQLIHWHGLENGGVIAIGLQRARWMAEIIARLPDSSSLDKASPAQIRLVDAEGRAIYVWGTRQPRQDERAVASIHLSSPLKPWQLEHFGPSQPLRTGKSATLINLVGSGGLLFAGLAALAYYLSQEINRQTRDARQRVNFVNQVSHELKTPLTNIRMYADLLELDLQRIEAEDDQRAQAHLAVITGESSRLSRLINNVLTFARLDRDSQSSRAQQTTVDDVIRAVVEQFRPSIEQLGLDVHLDLHASDPRMLDVDALEQILGNLISNVEKYAGRGKLLQISSFQDNQRVTIDVVDAGPGISQAFAKRVFEPFERASDHIEAATGTGIGLPIARSLARRCGGDLELLQTAQGAAFRITIVTQGPDTLDAKAEERS